MVDRERKKQMHQHVLRMHKSRMISLCLSCVESNVSSTWGEFLHFHKYAHLHFHPLARASTRVCADTANPNFSNSFT